ncbi:MAG: CDP-alcohol phosphatidyltransferase family protein [Actinobacteria bacterium]|nr:CDP-alcohol phosphatidyltransferase family protein [Actinomycetota bacterium]
MSQLPDEPAASSRILTIPNLISFARLLGVPVFLWLILVPQADGWAFVVLAAAGASDWVDGALARALNQRSELGILLDPLADRLYIAATLLGLALRGIIPWWLVAILVGRELFLLTLLPRIRATGRLALPVTYVGKSATFCLLWGFPLLLLGDLPTYGAAATAFGWAFALWGTYLSWWSGIRYAQQTFALRALA